MEYLSWFVDIFLHLDKHLAEIVSQFGSWTYGILFLIIFCETGLVVAPILPGDSLLFAAGAIASLGSLDVYFLTGLLIVAAIIGDSVNYQIGAYLGPKVFKAENPRFFKRKYLEQTEKFYEKHGGKTIIIARFIPIIRTYAPFVAGVGSMSYGKFLRYNIIGAVLWVGLFVVLGYWFGQQPIVKKNFSLVIIGIVILSVTPPAIEYLRAKYGRKTASVS